MKKHPLRVLWGPISDSEKSKVMSRIGGHDARALNAIANAVVEVQGYTPLSVRYSIAILALEALDRTSHDSSTTTTGEQ